ncbi:sodium:solute symporter [Emticicia sp. C21]|uniref:sodium:solute symporter n=1 Tax=Emticicia sp. C21 TaxID=2302915 RepID=UPI000E351408|nr:sodium:solute symporter [Emticicia sp. C21]RFS14039.1 sodium:solute symporter [Emticicia sp. C21]
MSSTLALTILVIYFLVLIAISIYTARGADTNTFFTANRQSPWYLVAFGMIGTSISGVTFVSVPGAVGKIQFSYFQVVLGYAVGYWVIATILMPMYYRLNLISIYGYLEKRFGFWSYKTGSAFFLLSRTVGSAVRMYVAVQVLQLAIFEDLGVPFELTVLIAMALIFVYTFKGGVKTIIITDTLQTFFLLTALVLTIYLIAKQLNLSAGEVITSVTESPYSKIFVWDWANKHHFVKDFLSGAFIAMTMTGLDQDLMQKNLTCKSIGEAQKNMFWFYVVLVFVNLLFLSLGVLLYVYSEQMGFPIPAKTDDLYPSLALGNHFGTLAAVTFLLGITAATYASSDSALTALTTSFCVDFLKFENRSEKERQKLKQWTHIGFTGVFIIVIVIFKALNSQEVISAVFNIAGYTYGPLLGLFAFGLYNRRPVIDKFVPFICIASPILTYLVEELSIQLFEFEFGFSKLMLNGFITFVGLWIFSSNKAKEVKENVLA